MKSKIFLHPSFIIGKTDPRLFGSFIEHLGRAVYHGIYEPGHPDADEEGFRKDVLNMVKKLGVPIVRYPGGNFVSGYRWEDGIGPKESRPRRLELAWQTIETNQVGIGEFASWCKKADTELMMAVNLGTRGPDDARNLVEYCNTAGGTYYSDLRRGYGDKEPYGIKLWCMGNEMDGELQMGHKEAREYGRTVVEAAKLMKWTDPEIELVACGSSGYSMCGEWEAEVLKVCYEYIDYISLHSYYGNRENDTSAFLAENLEMETFIKTVTGICDYVKKVKGSGKTINLSFDEWNVWFHSNGETHEQWSIAPHQLEDIYNFEDALVVGCLLMTLLRHCDRVKIACLAQLVNVIAPIMTENTDEGGRCWAQTIFYPFMLTSAFGRGTVLDARIESPVYATKKSEAVPYLETVAVRTDEGISLFAVNRSLEEDMEIECDFNVFGSPTVVDMQEIYNDDLKAVNTADAPGNVMPEKTCAYKVVNGILHAYLKKHSWNMIRIALQLKG